MTTRESGGKGDHPVTERVNPRTRELDQLPLRAALELLIEEDAGVPAAVRRALPQLERAGEALFTALAEGGRWINVGAGTSGRLGALDAAEIPPTFGLPPDRVQAVLAGGPDAMTRAVEGCEDSAEAGADALRALDLSPRDAVVALSASGRTPFVLGAVEEARRRAARTIAITCAERSALACAVEIPIALCVGPEALAGSTRMKGGLAQKMVLHTLSTAVMARLGRVSGNLMIAVRPQNAKLRARAISIVCELAGTDAGRAAAALDAAQGSVPDAVAAIRTSQSR